MADPIVHLAKHIDRVPPPPCRAGERWEIADILARVDAALVRRRVA